MFTKIPTNIISGFLGVGKTTAILQLLKQKPDNKRWAVLVNEFGEIGVDSSLFQGQLRGRQEVFLKEVPGGCMCCSAGLPMQAALNLLLTKANPHRLLIEPTGIGHPIEVLAVLSEKNYQNIISIQKIVTLVDARKLKDTKYTKDETSNQQIAIADILIGNKQDLYEKEDKKNLLAYARANGSPHAKVLFSEQGVLPFELLEGKTKASPHQNHQESLPNPEQEFSIEPIPDCGYIKAVKLGKGFKSIGWRFSPLKVFDHLKLLNFLRGLKVERMKAVFITINGVFGYNLSDSTLLEMELDDTGESRIEIISTDINENWEGSLLACLIDSV